MSAKYRKTPNELLSQARKRRLSPSGSGRRMSRQELADLVNVQLTLSGLKHPVLDASYVGKLERGEIRWPQRLYRQAFRAVLGASSDYELGFFVIRREPATQTSRHEALAHLPITTERRAQHHGSSRR